MIIRETMSIRNSVSTAELKSGQSLTARTIYAFYVQKGIPNGTPRNYR